MQKLIKSNRRQGFTLLELLVIVVVLAVLSAIAIPNFTRAVERARVQDVEATLSAIFQSERLFELDNGTFGTLGALIAGNYVTDPDPGNSNPDFNFAIAAAATTFTVTATRTGGAFNGDTITVNQNFDGVNYGGSHPLI